MSNSSRSRRQQAGPHSSYCCYLRTARGSECIIDDYCYQFYLRRLLSRGTGFGIRMHAWTFMPDEVFLLLSSGSRSAIPDWIASVNACFGEYFQQRFRRPVKVFPRLRAMSKLQGSMARLNCQKFIEREGSRRAGLKHPGQHHWSSYARHALGHIEDVTVPELQLGYSPLPALLDLRNAGLGSRRGYRDFVAAGFTEPCQRYLRLCFTHGKALGPNALVQQENLSTVNEHAHKHKIGISILKVKRI